MNALLVEGLDRLIEGDRKTAELLKNRRDEIAALLERYMAEIELFNRAYGLVGTMDTRELAIKHILDSLAPLGIILGLLEEQERNLQDKPHIADAGSGAGLPGIPLAIALPRFSFTLIERMGRRAGFLRNTLAILALPNVCIEEAEVEKAPPDRFSLIVCRAFRPLESAPLKALFRLLKNHGALAAYKGRRDTLAVELASAGQWGLGWEIIPCPVPFLEEERHLAVYRKTCEADQRSATKCPRPTGLANKSNLNFAAKR